MLHNTHMAVELTRKDPRALLQDMWDLLASEVETLKKRQVSGHLVEDFDAENSSKQLQRLISSIRGAIKDSKELEEQLKADAEGASEIEIIEAIIDDPTTRTMVINALDAKGWKVASKTPVKKRRVMRSKESRKELYDGVMDGFAVEEDL